MKEKIDNSPVNNSNERFENLEELIHQLKRKFERGESQPREVSVYNYNLPILRGREKLVGWVFT